MMCTDVPVCDEGVAGFGLLWCPYCLVLLVVGLGVVLVVMWRCCEALIAHKGLFLKPKVCFLHAVDVCFCCLVKLDGIRRALSCLTRCTAVYFPSNGFSWPETPKHGCNLLSVPPPNPQT